MKVLLINRNDFVDGGADRVFMNTYELLKALEFQSFRVSEFQNLPRGGAGEVDWLVEKFTRREAGIETSVDPRLLSGWKKLLLVKDYLYNRQVARSLERRIHEFQPDVAHVHLIFGTLSVSVLRVLKQHRVPVVMTIHDYRLICPANAMLERHGKVCEKCEGKRYFNCLIHRCSEGNLFFSAVIMLEAYMRKYLFPPLKLANHFIFVSQFAKSMHLKFVPGYALKSSHIYNMNVRVKEMPITRGDYFLYFGRLSREKGIQNLIYAVAKAGVKLVIAGTGPQEEEIRRLIVLNTLRPGEEENRIEYVGFKSGEELERLIRGCLFTVVPSEWYENNPMSVVESFSLGKPVIGSRIGGIPELVTPENGFLFDPGNPESLMKVLKKAENMTMADYTDMSSACREFASKNFDPMLHFEGLSRIYKQVAQLA